MSLQRIIILALTIVISAVAGGAIAIWQIDSPKINDGQNGGSVEEFWITDLDIGSTNATGLLRAQIARKGLFALNRSEAVYYTRTRDDAGTLLNANCTYEISGGPHPAEWWSLTLYGADNYLARNTDEAASLNGADPRLMGTDWIATISQTAPDADMPWLSSRGVYEFDLTLRLYRPDLDTLMASDFIGFPSVTRLDCEG